ncbi:CatB-related O-acetyltransferase [Methylotenera sp.]|uniref:CatB-related O-acetyltransferase n=1 Tax=Methylotenera sp. TaxID=2051956 RepID=UPI00272FFC0F|nr:CatB-related O-acetyltransferase [Methylotenera sp.]MDP2070954.1 CatB-related O-acetyltransferase [Methylotenera sp.]MDP3005828.1 CatB-related O-acetyltransferase [Methylotenera sp.]
MTGSKSSKGRLQSFARQQAKFAKRHPNYTIGTASYGLPIVHDNHGLTTLKIGAYCSIASNVQIFLGGQHCINWVSSYPFPFFFHMDASFREKSLAADSRGDVIIGSDVWLCANCIILSGVTIGHGAVIANGAIISRDVEPYAVMAGNPAKLVKWRFEEPTRKALLESKWWEWPEDEISRVMENLCSDDITDLLHYSKARNATN